MRFIHASDLHIGKMVNGFSMLEEQKSALDQIIHYAKERQAEAVLLSGDLYDRSVPPASAVSLLDSFLTELVEGGIPVFAIAGNHDCGERIGFAGKILRKKGLFMSGRQSDPVEYADVRDQWGEVRIHMMPFARPAQIRAFYGDDLNSGKPAEETYEGAMKILLSHVKMSDHGRDVLLTHQFVVWDGKEPELSDSETRVSPGGFDCVDGKLFAPFSYTALGHIHGCQQIGTKPVYYSGSPVKYSFSEVFHKKCVLYVEIGENGDALTQRLPIVPVHDMRKIKGKLSELTAPGVVESADAEDYILAVLTDDSELIDPIGTLRSVYPNVMQLQWDRKGEALRESQEGLMKRREKEPSRLFADFFFEVTGGELSEEQEQIIRHTVEQAKEDLS